MLRVAFRWFVVDLVAMPSLAPPMQAEALLALRSRLTPAHGFTGVDWAQVYQGHARSHVSCIFADTNARMRHLCVHQLLAYTVGSRRS